MNSFGWRYSFRFRCSKISSASSSSLLVIKIGGADMVGFGRDSIAWPRSVT